MQRLYCGQVLTDNFAELSETLERDVLVDSSTSVVLIYRFLMGWMPKWFCSIVLNRIASLFTKTKIYRKLPSINSDKLKPQFIAVVL